MVAISGISVTSVDASCSTQVQCNIIGACKEQEPNMHVIVKYDLSPLFD